MATFRGAFPLAEYRHHLLVDLGIGSFTDSTSELVQERVASMADLRQQSVDADLGGAHVRLPRFRSHPSPMRGQATHLSIPSKGEWTFGGQGAPSYDGETRAVMLLYGEIRCLL